MALRQDTVRLLVADDVGVGKTIEALLLTRELMERRKISRFAVICLPHLCDQWQKEIREKLDIEAVIIRSSTQARLDRQIHGDTSVYEYYPHQIISRSLLPAGFEFDSGWEWIKAVGFGQAAKQQAEVRVQKRQQARELGFADDDALSDAQEFARLPAEERKQILARKKGRDSNELPQSESSNPDRRAKKVEEKAAEVPERQAETRERSVSVDGPAAKEDARVYLRSMYTLDGEMYCQACRDVLPFKTADGKHFFEAVEFIQGLTRRHHENYLALCPNHAAMIEHACERPSLNVDLSGSSVSLTMAEEEFSLHFTQDHLNDLRAIQEVYVDSPLVGDVDDTVGEPAQVMS